MSSGDDSSEDASRNSETEDSNVESDEQDTSVEPDEASKKLANLFTKSVNVRKDIALIREIFAHIDQTSNRIVKSFVLQEECSRLTEESRNISSVQRKEEEEDAEVSEEAESAESNSSDDEIPQEANGVSWSDYERLNDGQRAELLAKSLEILNNAVNSKVSKLERNSPGRKLKSVLKYKGSC